jgi:cytidyltransferase-like protein
MKRILTYGTFDLLHYGHIRLLQRAKAMGDYLVVPQTRRLCARRGYSTCQVFSLFLP